ncbi:TrmB family transcriptional regulator [Methanofollis formosanus]|uniref:TrmB family transcriptional regulator n=1 Tax=Methanofollis formosanus TaxID=299308 RepID=A0A8G1EGB3_9EURY|nr:TrmB family transcriptional regulator [Methanofollis formosanus]QYZ79620.1 TrmB family transcriptional regulator [Methanofollis formosanus]
MSPPPQIPQGVTTALKTLGLTKYEALVYVALLRVTSATATEIHEISGVPRASVYPVLDRLLQKNLVTVSHTTPKRFNAIPPEEAINSLMREIEEKGAYAKVVLGEIYAERASIEGGGQELIWNILGEANIKSRMRDLIARAQERVEVIGSWVLLEDLQDALAAAVHRGVRVEVIASAWEDEIPEGMEVIVSVPPIWHKESHGTDMAGVLFVDREKVLVAMGGRGEVPTALYSESEGFARFFSRYAELTRSYLGKIRQR